ncbi:MAG: hypothetical protein KIPDCIKN_01414 [Haliscomenobacter sp.]|jgi:hypothetical protein|nr:hypothetical protein [Haliscomenobacter sp.]
MKSLIRFFAVPIFLFLGLIALNGQSSVRASIAYLDSALQNQPLPMLRFQGDADVFLPVFFVEALSGGIAETEGKELGIIRKGPHGMVALITSGVYEVQDVDGLSGLVLQYGQEQAALKGEKTLRIENTPFWIRIYEKGAPSIEQVFWKNEAAAIFARLTHVAGHLEKQPLPLGFAAWRTLSSTLEENPFLRNQLGPLRLSEIPSGHPLAMSLAETLNREAIALKENLPVLAAAASEPPAPSLSYFSLQDMEKNYREPVIADAAMDLRQAGDRLQVKRQAEGFNATAIAAGLTDFIIERAKEEFSVSFLERMQHNVGSGGGIKELCVLFPETCDFFGAKADLSRYKSMLPLARETFVRDLRSLGLHLHGLLELEPYRNLQNTSSVYNLALFYDIASMAYQGIALDTLLDNVFGRLQRRESQLFLQGNRVLAESGAAKPDLQTLQSEIQMLSSELDLLSKQILQKNVALESAGFLELQLAAEEIGAQETYQALYQAYLAEISQRDQRLVLWLGKDRHDQLRNIPRQLEGRRYYDQLLRYPKLDQYPQLFGAAPDSLQLIASGVELSKKLVNPMPGSVDMPSFLAEYFRYLEGVEQEVARLTQAFQAATPQAIRARADSLDQERTDLLRDLEAETRVWEALNRKDLEEDIAALKFLGGALTPQNDPSWMISRSLEPEPMQDEIARVKEQLLQAITWIEERLLALEKKSGRPSALLPSLTAVHSTGETAPAAPSEESLRLDVVLQRSARIKALLDGIDQQHNRKLSRAREETLLMENVVEMSSRLLACLRISPEESAASFGKNRYLAPDAFRELMRSDRTRDLFLGVVQERLQNLSVQSRLSPRSVAAITSKFIEVAHETERLRDSLQALQDRKPQFMDYFPMVRLAMDLLHTLIENPLTEGDTLFKNLRQLPEITGQTLSMFENVQGERYGSAIFNLVELFRLVSQEDQASSARWQKLRSDFLLYGSFMANVATAQTAEEVKGALLAAALPPGSSRVKREDAFNLAFNGYLGVTGGREALSNSNAITKEAYTIGLSMPIGVAVSWKFKSSQSASYSLMFSMLDLGAVASFRLGDQDAGLLPELSFENLVAPGAYFLLNVPRSPFSLGFGSQYGPRARKITLTNGLETRSSAWRWLLFAGVDVPIFNFATQKVR